MKIYFAGSIRGGRDDLDIYIKIIEHLKTKGQVLTEHVADKTIKSSGENLSDEEIYDRDLGWLDQSDVIVAEITNPSLGVGYEIGMAVRNNKKTLCLYQTREDKQLSAMIAGCKNLVVREYRTLEEAKKIIDEFI
jgi:nucleoside 2-deoxyribosyltransferase